MTYLIPFLTSPVGCAFQAYTQATYEFPLIKYEFPLVKKGGFLGDVFPRRVFKHQSEYSQLVKTLPGYRFKESIQPFLDQQGIRKDLIVCEVPNIGFNTAMGTNRFMQADAAIFLSPGFMCADAGACHWVIKYEISHIKNNDAFNMHLISSIVSAVAAVFGALTLPWVTATLLTMAVGLATLTLFSQLVERRADAFAIENSSVEELMGGRRFFKAMQNMHRDERQTFWKKVEFSAAGENRLDLFHPSLSTRVQRIENELKKRGMMLGGTLINRDGEDQKIEVLKGFLKEKKRELENEVAKIGGFWGLLKAQMKM
jgi:hypothetical protein